MASLYQFLVRCFLVVAFAVAPALTGPALAADLGETITNVARVAWNDGSERQLLTNEATITVEAARTDSTIEFFRYSPSLPGATQQTINGSDYAPDGNPSGTFVSIGPAINPGNSVIDLSTSIPLTSATAYLTGEVMFVRVLDAGQNGNPNSVETVVITVESSSGDAITLRLYESGPDTGEFWAYVPSEKQATPRNDTPLTTGTRSSLTATYVDAFDASEISVDTALVDPFGRVFNAVTGELLDDVPVTLINSDTGQPAEVFGADGVSRYPSSITTGSRVVDAGGLVYQLETGEFRFPLVAPGTYEIRVDEPAGLLTSSILDAAAFEGFDGAPWAIIPAS